MPPENLGFENCDLDKILLSKETQTAEPSIQRESNTSVKSSVKSLPRRPPLPRDLNKSDKGSISVFEFCQILQDPESPKSITIVKETVSEEIHNHSDKVSIEDAISNRYRYCKEVIRPYLKSPSVDCPDSDEKLIKDALDSISTDFPDYQPCFDIKENTEIVKDNSKSSSVIKVDTGTSYTAKPSESMESKKDKECSKDKTSIEPKKSKECINGKSSLSGLSKPKCPPPIDSCKETISPQKSAESSKSKSCPAKKGSDACMKEPTIGIEPGSEDKPTYIVTERCKDNDQSSTSIQTECKPKSMIDAHNETIATIKCAMEDFIGKAYKTTKDAVTLITTESAKQLEKIRKTESCNTDSPMTAKKPNENKSAETLTSFNFFRKTDQQENKDQSTVSRKESVIPADMYDKISDKVDSMMSVLSDSVASFPELPNILKPSNYYDTSSEYDVPKPPKKISNVTASDPGATGIFTAIKSKIFSIFNDGSPHIKLSVTESSSSDSSSESDDMPDQFND